MTAKSPSRKVLFAVALAIPVVLVYLFFSMPSYSFHLFCTYTSNSRLAADIRVGGETHTATVVYQNARSRSWIAGLNSAGCRQTHGTVLVYRLNNDRVIMVPSGMCRKAEDLLTSNGQVDVLKACNGRHRRDGDGFAIDSARNPRLWRSIDQGSDFKITRMVAEETWDEPTDEIDTIAPNLLRSTFDYAGNWWHSPERALPFERRYYPAKSFEFKVKKGMFAIE